MKIKYEENCIFYNEELKNCNALTRIRCAGCRFKKLIGETKIEYDVRKNTERVNRDKKCDLKE